MDNRIGKEFMEMTKYQHLEPPPQSQGMPMPLPQIPVEEGAIRLPLPAGRDLPLKKVDLANLVEQRETLRNYSDEFLTLQELGFLLWGTQGVKSLTPGNLTKRIVPSAGSRHPFETYLLINRVETLQPGLYRYLAIEHELARLDAPQDIRARLMEACKHQEHVAQSAVTFAWAAVPMRTTWRYSQRAYRYILLDAGHVCQNLYLLAEAIGCGVCAIAAYEDDLVNRVLGLDGEEQLAVYLASLGKRAA